MSLSTINIAPIEHFLRAMTAAGATDLMLTAHTQPRMRVDGRLNPIEGQPVLTPAELRRGHRRAADARAAHASCTRRRKSTSPSGTTGTHRFRGNCFIQQGIVALSLRSIPLEIPSFDTLLLPWGCEHFCNLPQGLVLVTGPTGSGKSTTLASMIDYINCSARCTSSRSRTRSSTCTSTRSAS